MKKVFCTLLVIITVLSCEKLDLKRVMDSKTDTVKVLGTTVIAQGTVLDIGSAPLVGYGHCWSVNEDPTKDDFLTDLGTKGEPGDYESELHSVLPGKIHYIKSYVFDGTNYIYGKQSEFIVTADDIEFTTTEIAKPDVIGDIQVSSSSLGVGSVNFSEHGHCWSQVDPPTINDGRSSFGPYESDVSFSSDIRNLNLGTYYIRGYLENDGVVVYTNTVKYESIISVKTGLINVNSEKANGEIKSLGVDPIIDYGHCWSTLEPVPNINTTHSSLGPAFNLSNFSSDLEGLVTGRTYYVRAYAFDGSFYYYGEVETFVAN